MSRVLHLPSLPSTDLNNSPSYAGPCTARHSTRIATFTNLPPSLPTSSHDSGQSSFLLPSTVGSTYNVCVFISLVLPVSSIIYFVHPTDPIIDPSEFCSRFFEFAKGNCNALDISGQLIAMILAVWATSFGVNEYGIEEVDNSPHAIRSRQERTNEMVREVLQLIDMHGVVRKPTWDGVRALLLLSPLTQGLQIRSMYDASRLSDLPEVQTPMERLVSYRAQGHMRSPLIC